MQTANSFVHSTLLNFFQFFRATNGCDYLVSAEESLSLRRFCPILKQDKYTETEKSMNDVRTLKTEEESRIMKLPSGRYIARPMWITANLTYGKTWKHKRVINYIIGLLFVVVPDYICTSDRLCFWLSTYFHTVYLIVHILNSLPVCLASCLSVYLPVCQPACLPPCLSVSLSPCLSVHLSACLPPSLSVSMFICPPVCLPTSLPVCLHVYLSTCLPAYLPAWLSLCVPVCRFVCLPSSLPAWRSVCLPACLPHCLSVCLPACLTVWPFLCLCLSVWNPVSLSCLLTFFQLVLVVNYLFKFFFLNVYLFFYSFF